MLNRNALHKVRHAQPVKRRIILQDPRRVKALVMFEVWKRWIPTNMMIAATNILSVSKQFAAVQKCEKRALWYI